MFFRLAFGGAYYDKTKDVPEEVKAKVPEEIELAYWDYYNLDKEMVEHMVDCHLNFNRKSWFFGGAWKWCGFNVSNQYSFDTTAVALPVCVEKGIDNVVLTMWGDNGNESSPYGVLPSLVYAAECFRGNYDLENAKKKFEELFHESWDDFMLLDFPMPKEIKRTNPYTSGAKEMLYNDYFVGKMDSMVRSDGLEGKTYGELAKKLFQAEKRSAGFGYLFRSNAELCKVLAIKYDLGVRTRKAYQSGDRKAVKGLLADYKAVLKGLEEFLESFRKTWMQTNKPHGFDVQDIRLGGVIARTKSCMARLKDYASGKIDKIEELEEEIVDFVTGEQPSEEMRDLNMYSILATVNIL